MFENMLKHVLGKMCNRGVNVYGGDKFRPYLYVLTSNVHNGQVSNLYVFKKKISQKCFLLLITACCQHGTL